MHRTDGNEGVGAVPRTAVGRQLVRVRARVRRRRLDTALAAGCSPWGSADLIVRAAQLVSAEERRKVAVALQTLVECAEHGRPLSAYLKIREPAVLHERAALLALAARLAGSDPVPAAVVAQLEWLLWDERSPLYAGGESPELISDVTGRCLVATV
jgi:hypothetical protein